MRLIRRFCTCPSGATAIEYGVIAAIVILGMLGGLVLLGGKTESHYKYLEDEVGGSLK